MPNCQAIDPLVTPYVDRELPDADRQRVDEHLRVCAPCHSRVAAEQAVRDLVHARQLGLCRAAPPFLRAKCSKMAAEAKAHAEPGTLAPRTVAPRTFVPRTSWTSRLAPMAMAASLVTVVGGAFVYQATQRSTRVMAAELAADHIKCFAMNAALGTHEKASSVESTMLSSFDWRVHLPADPSRAGLELIGARPCLYGEGKIAHIMYRHEGRPVSLFMLPNTERTQGLVEALGHEAAIWCANNRTFVLVSREPKADVQRLASFVQSSLH
jgi:anti-sigma factor RsiW